MAERYHGLYEDDGQDMSSGAMAVQGRIS
jgi:hypothetical protein